MSLKYWNIFSFWCKIEHIFQIETLEDSRSIGRLRSIDGVETRSLALETTRFHKTRIATRDDTSWMLEILVNVLQKMYTHVRSVVNYWKGEGWIGSRVRKIRYCAFFLVWRFFEINELQSFHLWYFKFIVNRDYFILNFVKINSDDILCYVTSSVHL